MGEWVNKLWCTMGYYSVIKTNELSSHEIMRKLKNILLNGRSQSEKATYCMIPIVWYSEEGKTVETVKGSVVSRGYLNWRMTKRSKEKFFREMKLPCMILQCWVHVIICLPKPIDFTAPRVNPNVNCELWMIMICQCRVINYNICITPVGGVNNERGGYVCSETGSIWEISEPSSQFFENLKSLYKKTFYPLSHLVL